jgi:hypothetical protein
MRNVHQDLIERVKLYIAFGDEWRGWRALWRGMVCHFGSLHERGGDIKFFIRRHIYKAELS